MEISRRENSGEKKLESWKGPKKRAEKNAAFCQVRKSRGAIPHLGLLGKFAATRAIKQIIIRSPNYREKCPPSIASFPANLRILKHEELD